LKLKNKIFKEFRFFLSMVIGTSI